MKRPVASAIALLAIAAFAGPALAGTPETFAEAKALAASEQKPLLIDFYATW
jgi:hypothetical protein